MYFVQDCQFQLKITRLNVLVELPYLSIVSPWFLYWGVFTHPKVSPHGLKIKSYSFLLSVNQARKPGWKLSWTPFILPLTVGFLHISLIGTHPKASRRPMIICKRRFLEKSNQWEPAANKHVSCFLLDSRKGNFALWLVTCTLTGFLSV